MNHSDLGFTDKWLSKRVKESKEFIEKYRINSAMMDSGNSPKIPIDGVKVISDTRIHQDDSPASRIMTNNLIHTLCGNANKIKGQ